MSKKTKVCQDFKRDKESYPFCVYWFPGDRFTPEWCRHVNHKMECPTGGLKKKEDNVALDKPLVEKDDKGNLFVGGNKNELTESWLRICFDVSRLCKLSRRSMQHDDCVACQVTELFDEEQYAASHKKGFIK